MEQNIRLPAVAGQFYTDEPDRLAAEIDRLLVPAAVRRRVLGVVAPHAGYLYSGAVAGRLYGAIDVPATVVIIGPNHHGVGSPIAISPATAWRTPLGEVPVARSLATALQRVFPLAEDDELAHRYEHSLEVQVPFLQRCNPGVTILPICLGGGTLETFLALGQALGEVIAAVDGDLLVVASSDMSHYEPAQIAREKDEQALQQLLALDPRGLLRTCQQRQITMCGVVPAVVMLAAAHVLGASRAELVSYATSGDVTGDQRRVVAYAAVTVS